MRVGQNGSSEAARRTQREKRKKIEAKRHHSKLQLAKPVGSKGSADKNTFTSAQTFPASRGRAFNQKTLVHLSNTSAASQRNGLLTNARSIFPGARRAFSPSGLDSFNRAGLMEQGETIAPNADPIQRIRTDPSTVTAAISDTTFSVSVAQEPMMKHQFELDTPAIDRPVTNQEKPVKAQAETAPVSALPSVVTEAALTKKALPEAAEGNASNTEAMPDFDRLSYNMARLVEQGGKAAAAYLKPFQTGEGMPDLSNEIADAVRSIGRIAEHWLSDPNRSTEAQTTLSHNFLDLWGHTLRRLSGEAEPPLVPYDPSDKRFAEEEWRERPFFDFFRQAHAITSRWADDLALRAEDLDPHTRDKARFYIRQISSALSPSNFLPTNPELLRETLSSSGDNLVRGAGLFAEDIEAGKGMLKIRQTDASAFELGVNMAMTPGKVVFRNDLMELIQYEPTTETVFKRPLLIVPPWINKFYILDLNREKSFVRWAVAQGLTVFVVSWVNPDERHRDKNFENYMREGIFDALDAIKTSTGEDKVTAIGYCVGGTLLATTLAYMAQENDERIDSATFFAAQTDFTEAGDLNVFIDEQQIEAVEARMAEKGYLEGSKMATAFNMLRPNDLIWSFVVNNYLKGQQPMPFDLLVWNSDSTRMPAANHSFYLRNFYLDNKLTKGDLVIGGKTLDLSKVTAPIYNLATREDHIAPAKSVFIGSKYFGGEMRYVLAGSGHIAGVVNPPTKPKYQFWTGPRPQGEFEDWRSAATEHKGSWWVDWIDWIEKQSPEKVPARQPGGGKLPALCEAPGEYVRVKC